MIEKFYNFIFNTLLGYLVLFFKKIYRRAVDDTIELLYHLTIIDNKFWSIVT